MQMTRDERLVALLLAKDWKLNIEEALAVQGMREENQNLSRKLEKYGDLLQLFLLVAELHLQDLGYAGPPALDGEALVDWWIQALRDIGRIEGGLF